MKPQLSASRERLTEKSRAQYNFNCQIAFQLYTIYKAEAVTKKEPRIPANDSRRFVLQCKSRVVLASYLKQQIISCMSSVRTSGNNLHHSLASLLRN